MGRFRRTLSAGPTIRPLVPVSSKASERSIGDSNSSAKDAARLVETCEKRAARKTGGPEESEVGDHSQFHSMRTHVTPVLTNSVLTHRDRGRSRVKM